MIIFFDRKKTFIQIKGLKDDSLIVLDFRGLDIILKLLNKTRPTNLPITSMASCYRKRLKYLIVRSNNVVIILVSHTYI